MLELDTTGLQETKEEDREYERRDGERFGLCEVFVGGKRLVVA